MTKIITCASGKGGAGKTMLTANLGVALAELGKNVVILDSNLTTPNLGLHLGLPLYPKTLHDILKGDANLEDAIYEHESGLRIVPAGIALKDLKGVDARDLPNALLDLVGNTEFVIIDAAAGLGREALAAIETADEMILVTTPELPAVTDALKAAKLAEQVGTKVSGLIINRVARKGHELRTEDIVGMLDTELLAEIPEDINVQQSISKKTPVLYHKPNSPASIEIKKLAAKLTGMEFRIPWYYKLFSVFRR
jgi:septum site-determining protein MinD